MPHSLLEGKRRKEGRKTPWVGMREREGNREMEKER